MASQRTPLTKREQLYAMRLATVRTAVADFILTSGCDCCRAIEENDAAEARLAKLLRVPKRGNDYDWKRFASKR